jgi:hypothetical protein
MSAIEMYLKEAQTTKGTWHKAVIANLRDYMSKTPEPEIISAINKIKDYTLLTAMWEVGLSQNLQDIVNKRSMILAGSK